jgi:adenine-specific DNA-methyltransferase
MELTRYELDGHAAFNGAASFHLQSNPFAVPLPLGKYELPRQSGEAHLYRLEHPLAQAVIERARRRELPSAEIHFQYGQHDGKISALEPYLGQSGILSLSLFTVESLGQAEDHLLVAARTDGGQTLDAEAAARLFSLPATVADAPKSTFDAAPLQDIAREQQQEILREVSHRNARYFEAEAAKLDGWADDLKQGLEREIKDIDRQIKETRRAATAALSLEEKLQGQKDMRALEKLRNEKRRNLYNEQDQVEARRDELIERISGSLEQRFEGKVLFEIKWKLNG